MGLQIWSSLASASDLPAPKIAPSTSAGSSRCCPTHAGRCALAWGSFPFLESSNSSLHPEQPCCGQAARSCGGGIVAFPNDLLHASAIYRDNVPLARIRCIRGNDERHHFTLICRDLSDIATYAREGGQPVPFCSRPHARADHHLEGTRSFRVLHPQAQTIGLQVPDHPDGAGRRRATLSRPCCCSTRPRPSKTHRSEEIRDRPWRGGRPDHRSRSIPAEATTTHRPDQRRRPNPRQKGGL